MTFTDSGLGASWLEFLSTRRGRYRASGAELLDTADHLADFLTEHGLGPLTGPSAADLEPTRAVREALHRTTVAVVAGRAADRADVARLDAALGRDAPARIHPGPAGLVLDPPADVAGALARIVRDAVTDLTGPRRSLLRPCADETCSGYFLDVTGRRRWCSDTRCGTRARVRAHRARGRAAPPPLT